MTANLAYITMDTIIIRGTITCEAELGIATMWAEVSATTWAEVSACCVGDRVLQCLENVLSYVNKTVVGIDDPVV